MKILSYGSSLTGNSGINGDRFYISEDKKVFVLADGASGAGDDGKVLMSETCVNLARDFNFSTSRLNAKEYVENLLEKINDSLIEISRRLKKLIYGTIVIAVFDGGTLTTTSMGDSPAYLLLDGEIKRVAKCPKRYENLIDKGCITKEQYEGYIDNMHYMMKSCFDRFLPVIVPVFKIEQYTVSRGDKFFMCSDGLSDYISPDKIFEALNSFGIVKGADYLIDKANKETQITGGYWDDITIVAIEWK